MKALKTILYTAGIFALLFCSFSAMAQQRAQYTQYMLNNYALNPAVGGVNNFWDVKTGFRSQWTGFEGAPRTFFLSGHGSIGYPNDRVRGSKMKPHHGVGGYLFHDKTGPIVWSGVYGSYSYHLKLTNKLTASMGAFAGVMQYQIKGSELVFIQNPDDPMVGKTDISRIAPDASVGIWLYSDHVYVGISTNQILQSRMKLKYGEMEIPSQGRLNNHYFITTGYKIKLNKELDLIPSTMIKYVHAAPIQVDINAKLKYKNMFWGGVSYRHEDALAVLAGILINNNFEIGYSYDLTASSIRSASSGSHEIIAGVRLPFKSSRIMCPNNFWD